ncbi:MAG: hypothetical protein ACTSUR_02515 [Candidatus Heimdallarchaeaceae archaeon]
MVKLWEGTEELENLTKETIERRIEKILLEADNLTIKELYSELWHEHFLLNQYFQILLTLRKLEEEGKIIIGESNTIFLARISILEHNEVRLATVWELEHKEEEIKKRKKIVERYQTINYLA